MKLACLALACGLAVVGTGHFAQADDLTQDEIIQRFQKQKTRGLKIVSTTPEGAESEATVQATEVAPAAAGEEVFVNISFDFDSAALREDQKPRLTALCGAMQAMDGTFRVLGHTDSSGTAAYNARLSKLRAEEVKRYLISDCKIDGTRLEAVGVGEEFPLDPADPRADVNRRVEFQMIG